MLIKRAADIKASEITPESVYAERRRFLTQSLGIAAGLGLAPWLLAEERKHFTDLAKSPLSAQEPLTSYEDASSYNNFYEFGSHKSDPKRHAASLQPRPWTVTVSGEAEQTGRFDLDDLLRQVTLEERIYRLRCVEGWSMVIPWVGFSLASLLKRFKPTSKAKYVAFTTLHDPKQFPAQDSLFNSLDWPYVEGLRMDEALHPLTLLAVGLYGRELPNQNGAPLRLVVPWKYGFKSIKSIVKIHFSETEPPTTWNRRAPQEYGFYANVNPQVDHPRWSQAKERRIGEFFRRDTALFNGYAEQVGQLYAGMDLEKFY